MQHFQVNSSTVETKIYQNPAFHRNGVGVCKDESKDVSLAVGERRLNVVLIRSGTLSSKAEKHFLLSLRHPGQDFFI